MKLEKTTNRSNSTTGRVYDDACAAAHAMDIMGERWAMPVMRELMLGPKRFSDLRRSLPGISANVLTQRLQGLEASGVVRRRQLPPPAAVQVYELTRWGYEARPVFQALGRWGVRSPRHDPTRPFSPTSLALSLRTMIDLDAAKDIDACLDFRIGDRPFRLTLARGTADIAPGECEGSADVTFAGEASAMAAALYAAVPLAAIEKEGTLEIAGDRALAERFVTLFPMPDKAELPEGGGD